MHAVYLLEPRRRWEAFAAVGLLRGFGFQGIQATRRLLAREWFYHAARNAMHRYPSAVNGVQRDCLHIHAARAEVNSRPFASHGKRCRIDTHRTHSRNAGQREPPRFIDLDRDVVPITWC